MTPNEWRAQGAEACRAYFAEHADHFTELCRAGQSDTVIKAILMTAGTKACERTGKLEATEESTAICEGFVAAADAEITVMREKLPILLTELDH